MTYWTRGRIYFHLKIYAKMPLLASLQSCLRVQGGKCNVRTTRGWKTASSGSSCSSCNETRAPPAHPLAAGPSEGGEITRAKLFPFSRFSIGYPTERIQKASYQSTEKMALGGIQPQVLALLQKLQACNQTENLRSEIMNELCLNYHIEEEYLDCARYEKWYEESQIQHYHEKFCPPPIRRQGKRSRNSKTPCPKCKLFGTYFQSFPRFSFSKVLQLD